jgi:RNA-binding protein Musashi
MPNPFRIFLSKVPLSVTNDDLSAHFSKFGTILDVYIPFNPATQQPKGMAFVSFSTNESVEQALACKEHILGGEAVEAKRADPKPDPKGKAKEPPRFSVPHFEFNPYEDPYGRPPAPQFPTWGCAPAPMDEFRPRFRVFIRDVPDELTEENLRQYFETFGTVTDVYLPVARGANESKRRGIAYITFKTEQYLDRCLSQPRHEINGLVLAVNRADDRVERKPKDEFHGRPMFPAPDYRGFPPEPQPRVRHDRAASRGEVLISPKRIFVGGIPLNMSSAAVADHFKQYGGEITDIYFPKDVKTGGHRGFCYITFAEELSVHRAVANAPREIEGSPIGDVKVAEARPGQKDSGSSGYGVGREADESGMYGGRMGYPGGGGGRGFDRGGYDRGGYDRGGYGSPGGYNSGGGYGPSGYGPAPSGGAYGAGQPVGEYGAPVGYAGGGYGQESYGGQPSYPNRYDAEVQPHIGEAVRGLDELVQTLSGKINPLIQALSGQQPAVQAQAPPPAQPAYGPGYAGGYPGGGPVMRGHEGYPPAADSRYRPY